MFYWLLILSLLFALLFIVASALFADYPLDVFYDAGFDKHPLLKKYTTCFELIHRLRPNIGNEAFNTKVSLKFFSASNPARKMNE